MTIVTIWKLGGNATRAEAVQSILECASESTFPNYDNPDRDRLLACDIVQEIVRRANRDASSANANTNGFELSLKNPISNDELISFRKCFHYSVVTEKPVARLKLFRVAIIKPEKTRLHPPATVQNHTLLILSCTKAEAFVAAVAHDSRYAKWDIELKEIEGPFTNGQIIMDFGLRTISTLTDPLAKDF